jgi:hypothetical protein
VKGEDERAAAGVPPPQACAAIAAIATQAAKLRTRMVFSIVTCYPNAELAVSVLE